jgi:phosphate transport system substrate-binding protein
MPHRQPFGGDAATPQENATMNGTLSRWTRSCRIAVACIAMSHAILACAVDVTGAGSTFVYPLLMKWAATYYVKTGQQVNYLPTGSGNGVRQIKAARVTFGASDMPLMPEELQSAGLAQFPLVIGGVVPVVKLAGVGPGQLRLTGAVIADIYLGKITDWSDPAIAAINPGLSLPGRKIVVVHRGESSGTTFNWASFLSATSPEWRDHVGAGTSIKWPTGVGATGNDGVAMYIMNVEGAIGYVELTYALQRKLAYTAVQNKSGAFVEPSRETFSEAVDGADWSQHADFYQIVTDAPGPNSWPITGITFVLVPTSATVKDAARSKAALDFFHWALTEGQDDASKEHYVALPPDLVRKIEAYWVEKIK